MKVSDVTYERLYSFGKYENERIRFNATLEDEDSPDVVIGALFFKVCDVEDCLAAFRHISDNIEVYQSRVAEYHNRSAQTSQRIAEMKVKIEEITTKLNKGERLGTDARLRHACDTESYEGLKKQLAEQKTTLASYERKLKEAIESKDVLKQRIKEGNFSLDNINVPKERREFY